MKSQRPTGMPALIIVMVGQVISLLGTGMTGFGLSIWIWQATGKATPFALGAFFMVAPIVLFSPIAGALVDRWNRKLVMMLSDLAAGLTTLVMLLLFSTGNLQIWHIYVINAVSGAFQAFQFPAFSAAVTMIVPREHYARASGMMSLARAASGIFAPMLAAALLGVIGFAGIMLIDVVTFVVAIGALMFVHSPQPAATKEGEEGRGSIWKESAYGFRYIFARPSLLGLQLVFFSGNLVTALAFTLVAPMILARTGDSELILGGVQSAGAIGGVVGGVLLSIWGGPKRKVQGVVFGWALFGLLGTLLLGLGRGLVAWAVASFLGAFFGPIIDGSNQAIWQSKVAPDVQGRVFSVRLLIAWLTSPLGNLLAGPLADRVFEPIMRAESGLSTAFGWLVGSGPGTGMALMFVLCGLIAALAGLLGYLVPVIRDAERILPDHAIETADAAAMGMDSAAGESAAGSTPAGT